jgi:hypothetical protein
MPQEKYEMKKIVLNFELIFLNFEKNWPYHERKMEKNDFEIQIEI